MLIYYWDSPCYLLKTSLLDYIIWQPSFTSHKHNYYIIRISAIALHSYTYKDYNTLIYWPRNIMFLLRTPLNENVITWLQVKMPSFLYSEYLGFFILLWCIINLEIFSLKSSTQNIIILSFTTIIRNISYLSLRDCIAYWHLMDRNTGGYWIYYRLNEGTYLVFIIDKFYEDTIKV